MAQSVETNSEVAPLETGDSYKLLGSEFSLALSVLRAPFLDEEQSVIAAETFASEAKTDLSEAIPDVERTGSALHLYLQELIHPLLTAEEEIGFAKTIEKGKEAESILGVMDCLPEMTEVEKQVQEVRLKTEIRLNEETILELDSETQTPEDVRNREKKRLSDEIESNQLYLKALTSDRTQLEQEIEEGKEARNSLIENNLKLVVSVARKFTGRGLALEDLIQDGNIGLFRGADKYDWKKGFRFSTYAYYWIRQNITRTIADQARSIRLPVYLLEDITRLHRQIKDFQQENGRNPNRDELAERTGLKTDKIALLERSALGILSLDAPFGEEDYTLGNFVSDEDATLPDEQATENVYQEALAEEMADIFEYLPERDVQILRMRYGKNMSLQSIADEMRLSKEGVNRIINKGLRSLRGHSQRLEKFL